MTFVEMVQALVRPVVTFVLVGAFVWGFTKGLIEPQVFVPILVLVAEFWFLERAIVKALKNGK